MVTKLSVGLQRPMKITVQQQALGYELFCDFRYDTTLEYTLCVWPTFNIYMKEHSSLLFYFSLEEAFIFHRSNLDDYYDDKEQFYFITF